MNAPKTAGEPQIFIVGMARSGTTLLSEILNAHSQIAASPETHYFRKYWVDEKKTTSEKRITLAKKFFASGEFKQFGFARGEKKEVENEVLAGLKGGRLEILDIVLTRYSLKQAKLLWCEKTPVHLLYLPQIAQLFPASKFICLLRDPRDVCLSLKKVPFNAGSTVSIARRWKRYSKLASLYRNEYKDRFLEVKYENLITSPEHEIKHICNFLGLGYEGTMLNRKNEPATFDVDKEYWKLNAVKPIDDSNYEKWKHEMQSGEIWFLQKFLRREMERCNYVIAPTVFDFKVLRQLLKIAGHWCFTVSANLTLRALGIRRYNW